MKSILDETYTLLMQSEIPYTKISLDTGLSFYWLLNFGGNYAKGKDFGVRKIECLLNYLKENK